MDSQLGPDQRHSRIRLWWPAFALIVTLIGSSHLSGKPGAPDIENFDKVAHFFVFGLMGTLFFRSVPLSFWSHRRWVLAWLGVLAYAVTDEWLQYYNPDRSFDPWDWVADGMGSILAIFLYRHWRWYRRLLEFNFARLLAK
ncbi:VanZ family protein [Pelagicoccus sp. SDUM812002]|uniref:VanZ family protein n=1 Tax=Pelagicoccus sp. SDUM812002 TaxID=3041266 RepID=UPI00280CFCB2|nr:VanZ family protein [Pelagicoccus sp. SDUM812002]MDQ8188304.1 VanZ family protein [Pelagicoccus sp. SDUM812002]